MVAVAAAVGVGVMVTSFRQTVVTWLTHSLQADIYVQPPSIMQRRVEAVVAPDVIAALRTAPGVAGLYTVRSLRVRTADGAAEVVTFDVGPTRHHTFRFKDVDPAEAWRAFTEEGAVLVSEPYSFRHGVGLGDAVQLYTDRGPRTFRVGGVYYDYASDQGVVMMARPLFNRWFDDRQANGVALYAAPGVDLDGLIGALQQRVRGRQEVIIRSNRDLRESSLEIFDRTFTITHVLRVLAVVVAFVGVLSALMALQLERARELAVLRANGMTPGQVWKYVSLQTGLLGLFAGVLAVPLGLVLALVLVYVINKRSFGWTLQFAVPPEVLVQAVLVAFVAALLAGLYPAWKMSRANPALALRQE